MKNYYFTRIRNHGFVGPGGINCPCCILGTKTNHKRHTNRIARRRLIKILKKELENTIDERSG